MVREKNWVYLVAILFLLPVLGGCGSMANTRTFVNPQADFSFYKKVALLPFRNNSGDQLAGERMTENFTTELLIAGKLEVMDPGQFNSVVAQVVKTNAPISTVELSAAHLSQIATVAGVEGIFMGTIHDFKMITVGADQYPLIAMTVKFIDAPTGTVVWQNSVHIKGGPNVPILTIGETFTLGELSQETCTLLVKDFYKRAYPK